MSEQPGAPTEVPVPPTSPPPAPTGPPSAPANAVPNLGLTLIAPAGDVCIDGSC